ncbi:MAG: hypothetical protein JXA36_00400 [Coriobacteriia bacterium]|nr:hypothetical protein [Coriobacteriia bacterium]
MEKLEKILHAEDAARSETEDARRAAAAAISEARAKAAEVLRTGREKTRELASARRDELSAKAREEAVTLQETSNLNSRGVLEEADARRDGALVAVMQVLKGR